MYEPNVKTIIFNFYSCVPCDYLNFGGDILDLGNYQEGSVLIVEKPVIYVYPNKQMSVTINLNINKGAFTVVYPKFNLNNNTWKINANPIGDIEINNRKYPYLFYECSSYLEQDTNEGFLLMIKMQKNFLKKNLKY